jgi:hypothetical protein
MVLLGRKRYAKLDRYLHHFITRALNALLYARKKHTHNVFLFYRCKTVYHFFFCVLEEGKENERETHRFHGNRGRGKKERKGNARPWLLERFSSGRGEIRRRLQQVES